MPFVTEVWWKLFFPTAQSELETDEVVPRLLSGQETGLSPQHTIHSLRRRMRSLDSPGTGPSYPDNIILALPAFGRDLYLNLTRDTMFLSGDFMVEERRSDQIPAVSRLFTKQLCFYSGFIVNHTNSLASISTCGGLVNTSLLALVEMFHAISFKQQRLRSFRLTYVTFLSYH